MINTFGLVSHKIHANERKSIQIHEDNYYYGYQQKEECLRSVCSLVHLYFTTTLLSSSVFENYSLTIYCH